MPVKNQAHEAIFFMWNHYSNSPVTSDTPTITLRTVTGASPTLATITPAAASSPTHIASGFWSVAITGPENNVDSATLMVDPSTGYSSCQPVSWHNEVVSAVAVSAAVDAIGILCTAILADTGTTLPATLSSQNVNMTAARNEIAVIDAAVDTEVAAIKTVVDAILVDTGTTLNDKIDVIDGIVDNILVDTAALDDPVDCNVTQVSGSSTAADNMELGALSMVSGVSHNSPTPTTSTFASDTGALSSTNNFYNGRILIFTSGTLAGQARTILDYTGASKLFSCDAFTTAPPNDSNFIIV